MRAVGYVRVSKADTRQGEHDSLSLDAQERAIRETSERKGWTLTGIERDNGKTGANTRREGLQRALSSLSTGRADVMVVSRLDRLSRSIADFGKLLNQAEREGWRVVVLDLDLDTTTPSGWFAAHVIALASEYERRLIAQRTREALSVAKANGQQLGRPSTIPQPVQRKIIRLHRNGHSASAIARRLTADAIPTPTGNARWHHSVVVDLIHRKEAS